MFCFATCNCRHVTGSIEASRTAEQDALRMSSFAKEKQEAERKRIEGRARDSPENRGRVSGAVVGVERDRRSENGDERER